MDIIFRHLKESDIDTCINIMLENSTDEKKEFWSGILPRYLNDILNKVCPSACLVAINKDVIVGFGCYAQSSNMKNSFKLTWINITPIHQRKGIGNKLVMELEKIIRRENKNFFQITLETDKPIFYNRLGYTTHSKDGTNCHMVKSFKKKLF